MEVYVQTPGFEPPIGYEQLRAGRHERL